MCVATGRSVPSHARPWCGRAGITADAKTRQITTYCRMVQQHSQHHHGKPAARRAPPSGELRAGGHVYRSVKEEIRQNLLARMRAGQDRFPGIVGFGQTRCCPHLERALLAGHDIDPARRARPG